MPHQHLLLHHNSDGAPSKQYFFQFKLKYNKSSYNTAAPQPELLSMQEVVVQSFTRLEKKSSEEGHQSPKGTTMMMIQLSSLLFVLLRWIRHHCVILLIFMPISCFLFVHCVRFILQYCVSVFSQDCSSSVMFCVVTIKVFYLVIFPLTSCEEVALSYGLGW